MQSCDEKSCDYIPRCKMSPSGECGSVASDARGGIVCLNTGGLASKQQCCDGLTPASAAAAGQYQAPPLKITKSGFGKGCFDVTLNDGTRGTYVKSGSLQDINPRLSLTPPHLAESSFGASTEKYVSKVPPAEVQDSNKETTNVGVWEDGGVRSAGGGLMRAGGRHQLVDIHGLAVFLRQSTRCLSCRAACCLYVTGTICAQLATVTQVKITCQKCHYTASQTLSRPSAAPDDPGSPHPTPPHPTPPSDTQSPHQPSPPADPFPTLTNRTISHQNPLKVLKEEQTSPLAVLLNSKVKGSPLWLSAQGTTSCGSSNKLGAVLPLQPLQHLEEVWGKEESQSFPQGTSRSSYTNKKPTTGAQKMLSTLDPMLAKANTDLCQRTHECSPSTSPPVLPHHQNKITSYMQDSTSATSFNSSQCVTTPGSSMDRVLTLTSVPGKPQGKLDLKETTPGPSTDLHLGQLKATQRDSSLPQVSSSASFMPTSSNVHDASTSSCVSPSSSLHSDPASSLLKLISTSVSSPLPFTLPLYSALFQHSPTPEPPPPLQTLEIEGKVVKGLEESLHLVKQIIKQGSTSHPSDIEVQKVKHSSSRTDAQVNSKHFVTSANDTVSENFGQASFITNLSSRQQTSIANDLREENFSNRCKAKRFPEEKDICFLKELPTTSRNRCTKKNQSKKQSKLKGNVKKRFYKVGNEHDRKRIKYSTKINGSQEESSHPAHEEIKNDLTDISEESSPLNRVHPGSKHNVLNDRQKKDHHITKQRESDLDRCTSFSTRRQCKKSAPDKYDLHKKNLELCRTQVNLCPGLGIDSSHVGSVPSWIKMDCFSNRDTCHCCSGSDLSTYMNCECSLTFNCKNNLFTLQNLRKSLVKQPELYGQCVRKRQLKDSGAAGLQTHPAEGPSGELGNVFDENTVYCKSVQDNKIDIPSDDIDNLKKNINLMDKNSIKLAIKSLMKNNARRNPQSRTLQEPKVSLNEDEVERYRNTHNVEREAKDCCLQGEGSSMSWRFHDLLSSDSSSDSDMDSGDGRLIIDTDK